LVKAEEALRTTGVSESLLKSSPTAALAGVAALKAQVTAQQVKIGTMRNYLSEAAPEFKSALNDLANLREVLAKQKASDESVAKGGEGSYIDRFREFKYYETLYELYAKQFEIARVDEAREGALIQVLDKAQPPERKSKPKKALNAIITTLAVGFALLLWVFVRRAIRNSNATDPRIHRLTIAFSRAIGRT